MSDRTRHLRQPPPAAWDEIPLLARLGIRFAGATQACSGAQCPNGASRRSMWRSFFTLSFWSHRKMVVSTTLRKRSFGLRGTPCHVHFNAFSCMIRKVLFSTCGGPAWWRCSVALTRCRNERATDSMWGVACAGQRVPQESGFCASGCSLFQRCTCHVCVCNFPVFENLCRATHLHLRLHAKTHSYAHTQKCREQQ